MRGYFEARGICFRQAFDAASGEFVIRPIRHPFMDDIKQTLQPIGKFSLVHRPLAGKALR